MSKPARWFMVASFFVIAIGACGDDDTPGRRVQAPIMSCTTSPCPGSGAGVSGAAGTSAGTGVGAPGFVGRTGADAGRGSLPPAAGTSATGPRPGGAAGLTGGVAGMSGAAGAAAGSGGMAAPAAGTMAAAGSGSTSEVPSSPACTAVSMWSADWSAFEVEVLRLVNENRAKGWNCDTLGQKPPVPPLTMDPTLRCSARLHSKDMAARMFFAHDNPDGKSPGARMTAAGYVGRTWGENIAKGQATPAQVVAGWMESDGHCSNIMTEPFTLIGVGYFAGVANNPFYNGELYWTQNFGAGSGGRR